jgi:hypothetical protein
MAKGSAGHALKTPDLYDTFFRVVKDEERRSRRTLDKAA